MTRPGGQRAGIFVSYRRGLDNAGAGRLRDRLARSFGAGQVFIDVDDIPAGTDFETHIHEQIARAGVVIVLIGSGWLAQAGRLHEPEDFVRAEVRLALADPEITVIPVLLDDAQMPGAEALPDDLADLAARNAFALRHDQYGAASGALVKQIRTIIRPAWPWRRALKVAAAVIAVAGTAWAGYGLMTPEPRLDAQIEALQFRCSRKPAVYGEGFEHCFKSRLEVALTADFVNRSAGRLTLTRPWVEVAFLRRDGTEVRRISLTLAHSIEFRQIDGRDTVTQTPWERVDLPSGETERRSIQFSAGLPAGIYVYEAFRRDFALGPFEDQIARAELTLRGHVTAHRLGPALFAPAVDERRIYTCAVRFPKSSQLHILGVPVDGAPIRPHYVSPYCDPEASSPA